MVGKFSPLFETLTILHTEHSDFIHYSHKLLKHVVDWTMCSNVELLLNFVFAAKPQEKLVDPPRFITHPLGLRLNDGDAATLECQISGTPTYLNLEN